MKIKIYTGKIEKGRVTVLGKWINGEVLRDKKCTVDEIMKDILISFSPIEEGWDSEGCVEPIIDNGFGIYYGYHHKA